MTAFGLTPQGFVLMRQSDVLLALQTAFKAQVGNTINLAPESLYGQICGIMSEREALLWEALDDIVASGTPAGAEGIQVDNLLAYRGHQRLRAKATVTSPTPSAAANGKTLNGLELYGTPGTLVKQGSLVQTATQPPLSFALDSDVTIGQPSNALQRLFFSSTPTLGVYTLTFEGPSGNKLTTGPILYNALPQQTQLRWSPAATTGRFVLIVGDLLTDPLPATATAQNIQDALQKLAPYATAGVQGAAGGNFVITWPAGPIPLVSVSGSVDGALFPINSVQAWVNSLVDGTARPLTDVAVTQPSPGQLAFAFGALTPLKDQPSSAAQAQGAMTVASTTLQAGNTVTNLAVTNAVQGRPALAVAQATCTKTGPFAVRAGTLTVIGSPVSGWAGVNNPLDAIAGRDLESDTEAVQRSNGLLAAQGNGTLSAVVQKVQSLPGVTAALGFANTTAAAQQRLAFNTLPTSGSFTLGMGAGVTTALAYNATAAQVQAALAALPGLAPVQVSGSFAYGFTVDFNGANGGQAQPLIAVLQDTTGAQLSAAFGRPPKSIELVIEGGNEAVLAQAILDAAPGGIATYAAPVLVSLGSAVAGSSQLPLASVANLEVGQALVGQGLRPGTTITGLAGNVVSLSQPALSSTSSVSYTASHTSYLLDAGGNPAQVGFSRPQAILIYVNVLLTTDLFLIPGVASSGPNPQAQFSPASAAQVQADIIALGNAVPIGGTIIARGTRGLVGAFNEVPGVLDYAITFDVNPASSNTSNLKMQSEQAPLFSTFSTIVSYQ